jgi:hypothetical protein
VVVPVDSDGDGEPNWYEPYIDAVTGGPIVKYDPFIGYYDPEGYDEEHQWPAELEHCKPWPFANPPVPGDPDFEEYLSYNRDCPCSGNRDCLKLQKYMTIPAYLRQTMIAYGIRDPEQDGIWDL